MQEVIHGPLSVEEAALDYAFALKGRLQHEGVWHDNAFFILHREYARFVWWSAYGMFAVQSMWEYAQLVEITDQYLRSKGSKASSASLYCRVCTDLARIAKRLQPLPFDQDERGSMLLAYDHMARFIKEWATTDGARE